MANKTKIYVGGPFTFFYKDYTPELLKTDFRYKLIGNDFAKQTSKTVIVGNAEYVGPFYYYQLGQTPHDVVVSEINAVRNADNVYLVFSEKGNAPGTVAELIHAAVLNKKLNIYYVESNIETEATISGNLCDNINHPYWYPFIQAKTLATNVKFTKCKTFNEATNKCLADIANL